MSKKRLAAPSNFQVSSACWHPAGGNSLWWRHYGASSNRLYDACEPRTDAQGGVACCRLHNMQASQAYFQLPSCCRLCKTPASVASPVAYDEGVKAAGCSCSRVAIFDLDGTLITTRSGKKFPVNANDWVLRFEQHLPAHLRRLHDNGYSIFILSNQLGVTLGHVSLVEMTAKVDAVQQKLQVPLTACLCCCDDIYRKPRPASAAFIFRDLLPLVQQHLSPPEQQQQQGVDAPSGTREAAVSSTVGAALGYPRIFFVGDSAGRPGDHSAADLKFALNVGMRFFTPEEFFAGKATPPLPLLTRRLQGAPTGKQEEAVAGEEAQQPVIGKDKKLKKNVKDKTGNDATTLIFDPVELLRNSTHRGDSQHQSCSAAQEGGGSDTKTDAEKHQQQQEQQKPQQQQNSSQELVILIGAPGSGKSTLVERLFPQHVVVRQDDLKVKAKCLEVCERLLREGRSVVVDRQNATKDDRQAFIQLAKQHGKGGCTVKGIALLWPKEVCLHMGLFRSLAASLRNSKGNSSSSSNNSNSKKRAASAPSSSSVSRYRAVKVPKVVVNTFYANVEHPTVEEGFTQVEIHKDVSTDFVLYDDFCSEEERCIFGSFLD